MNAKRIKLRGPQRVGNIQTGRSIWKELLQEVNDYPAAGPI